LKSGSGIDKPDKPKPKELKVADPQWNNVLALTKHCFGNDHSPFFRDLAEEISTNVLEWKEKMFDSNEPENEKIPNYQERISNLETGSFLSLCLVRSLREDRTLILADMFIKHILGEKFIAPVTDSIESVYEETNSRRPVI